MPRRDLSQWATTAALCTGKHSSRYLSMQLEHIVNSRICMIQVIVAMLSAFQYVCSFQSRTAPRYSSTPSHQLNSAAKCHSLHLQPQNHISFDISRKYDSSGRVIIRRPILKYRYGHHIRYPSRSYSCRSKRQHGFFKCSGISLTPEWSYSKVSPEILITSKGKGFFLTQFSASFILCI